MVSTPFPEKKKKRPLNLIFLKLKTWTEKESGFEN